MKNALLLLIAVVIISCGDQPATTQETSEHVGNHENPYFKQKIFVNEPMTRDQVIKAAFEAKNKRMDKKGAVIFFYLPGADTTQPYSFHARAEYHYPEKAGVKDKDEWGRPVDIEFGEK